jgi:hypothetical protein
METAQVFRFKQSRHELPHSCQVGLALAHDIHGNVHNTPVTDLILVVLWTLTLDSYGQPWSGYALRPGLTT